VTSAEPGRPGPEADPRWHPRIRSEQVLSRELSVRQQAMLAIGGALGTGLFLGSGLAVKAAGPGVVLSYCLIAALSLLLGAALTEMCVAHPTAGSFGVYAEIYVSPFAGYAVRFSYWLMQIIATGGHMVAVSIYMRYWFPEVSGVVWIVLFSGLLIAANAWSVGTYAEFEYWFVMVKVLAVAAFVALGIGLLVGATGEPALGLAHFFDHGGFLPMGVGGIWLAANFALYSFIGVEVVAVASGEARDPEKTIPLAMKRMVLGLSATYVVAAAVLVGVMPWTEAGLGESPFVSVLRRVGIPGAAGVMNFVIVTAALSAANANLYLVARTLFSLSRAGLVPGALGRVNSRGTPVNALLSSGAGLAVAVVVQWLWPDSAYVYFLGVALFGAVLVWFMIFVTHLAFRRAWGRHRAGDLPLRWRLTPVGSLLGAILMVALFATTWWSPGLRVTVLVAVPWLLVLAVGFAIARSRALAVAATTAPGS